MSRYEGENAMVIGDYYHSGNGYPWEYPKQITCPKCDGEKQYAKFTINLATGKESEEIVPCPDCNEEGRVWVDSPQHEQQVRGRA